MLVVLGCAAMVVGLPLLVKLPVPFQRRMAEATGVSYVHDAAKLARVAASQAGPGTRVVLAERARGDRRLAAKGFEVVRELELR